MGTVPYRECAHNYVVDDSRLPEMAVRCTECGDRIVTAVAEEPSQLFGDARAQLWARVYAAEFSACRHGTPVEESMQTANDTFALKRARALADIAVADFDEHYLGGKRS